MAPRRSVAQKASTQVVKEVVKNGRSRPVKRVGSKTVPPKAVSAKRVKIVHQSHNSVPGVVLTLGQGDVGQLGLGEDVMERKKPGIVDIPDPVVQVVAGGMHTACLTDKGEVYTFGCNDEGALGRDTSEEGSEMTPAKVEKLHSKIVQLSAGDSHTAALTDDGRVLIWGSFRDSSGIIGIMNSFAILKEPTDLSAELTIVKIASGTDHLIMLTDDGDIYSVGNSEQGQLGRVAECFSARGGRKGLECLIQPGIVRFSRKRLKFTDVWSGAYVTFAKEQTGKIFGWGLNNYYQLGTGDMENRFVPTDLENYGGRDWKQIAGGLHHSMALDSEGGVYVNGHGEYGRLGLGESDKAEKKVPTRLGTLNGTKCSSISCGSTVSYAVTTAGQLLSWGMGTNLQLGLTGDDDVYVPSEVTGKSLLSKKVLQVSGGGQHTVLLAQEAS